MEVEKNSHNRLLREVVVELLTKTVLGFTRNNLHINLFQTPSTNEASMLVSFLWLLMCDSALKEEKHEGTSNALRF